MLHWLHLSTLPSVARAILPALALCLATAAPAHAAPYTLRISGSFTPTSNATAAQNQLAQLVWGNGTWNNGRSASVLLELDFDDTLTAVAFNATQSFFAYETVTALRLTLGNVQLATTGLTEISKIDLALHDNNDPPSVLDGDGFALSLGQSAVRNTSTGAYTLPGAATVRSADGLYVFAFNTFNGVGYTPPVLEMRSYNATTMGLSGGSPTGRMTTTDWSVVAQPGGSGSPGTSGGSVPEPASLGLSGLALALLGALRQARAVTG